jgi:Flagellar biosynthesis protein, FliO
MRLPYILAGFVLLLLGQAAPAQTLAQGSGGIDISPWRVIASLVLCLALGGGAIYALRRRFGILPLASATGPSTKRIRLVEQQYLGPQRSICLIEIDGQTYAALFAPQATALMPLAGNEQGAAQPPAGASIQ